MNLELLWRCFLALPGLILPGFAFDAPQTSHHVTTNHVRTTAKATPRATATATPMPATKTTAPTAGSATPAARRPIATPAPTQRSVTVATPKPATPAPGASDIATEAQCPDQGDVSKTTTVLVCMTSFARAAHGLAAVSASSALMASGVAKDQDMLSCGYGHEACGRTFNYWMTDKGYAGRCTAENIAMGQKTPREVFVAWMNSAGHRANILNGSYKDIGVAELASSGGPLWVMELGGC